VAVTCVMLMSVLCGTGRSHMVQRSVDPTATSSTDVQQSVFASIDTVPAFSAAAAREEEPSRQQMPRLAELQVSPSPPAGKTSVASKKKLMSMAFQAQKQRREAVAAAAAAAAAAAEVSSNADTVSSSDTDTSPALGHDCINRVVNDLTSVDSGQAQADDSSMSEQYDAGSGVDAEPRDSLAEVDPARSIGAVVAPPKTLTPAKASPASLMTSAVDPEDRQHSIDEVLSSPVKLVPPADPQHIHAIVAADPAAATSGETLQPDTEVTQ